MLRRFTSSISVQSRWQGRASGFSLVEALMTGAVLLIALSIGMPEFRRMASKNRLESAVSGAIQVFQTARLAAIKRGVPVVVAAEFEEDVLFAFADVDDRDGNTGSDLSFDPDASKPSRNTDHEVARFTLASQGEPAARIYFWGIEDAVPEGPNSVLGFTPAPDGETAVAVFEPDGSIRQTGSLRLAMASIDRVSDFEGNFFEIRVSPRSTARIEVRKYVLEPVVGPPGYYPEETSQGPSNWQWY